jgi:hypothetical protein
MVDMKTIRGADDAFRTRMKDSVVSTAPKVLTANVFW